ncbi:MAG TPA: DUF3305 domain-containing protein [Paracoccaceae bacterium]|nr:DUF3305 domain-containing protein [Paracoccaceae bacterium]HMO70370.1 DUF3305 domain-containing protein [Paracoccaceae bacterium]
MPREVLRIGIVGRSWPPSSRWATRALRPHAAMDAGPDLPAGTLMHEEAGVRTVWLGTYALVLHHGETGHYRTNLGSARPSVWVSMEGDAVRMVTPDPYEGEALAGDPGRVVEALAMPAGVQAAVADFIARHHEDVPFHKRQRTPAPGAVEPPRAPRILPPGEGWGRR